MLRLTESMNCQSSATKYLREGNLTWQDEFDGIDYGASDGVMGLEYWWQHEEVLYYVQSISRFLYKVLCKK